MKVHIFQANYISKNGLTDFQKLKFSAKSSTQATISIYRQGPASQFATKIKQAQQQAYDQRQYGVKMCLEINTHDLFEAFKELECIFEGTQEDKKAMATKFGMGKEIKSFYKTRRDHVVNDTIWEGYVCDSEFYYQIIVHLKRPDYYC